MGRMLFIQFHSPDGKTVEGAASIYHDGKELPEDTWSVRRSKSDTDEIMKISDMPQHWQDEIKSWAKWSEKNI